MLFSNVYVCLNANKLRRAQGLKIYSRRFGYLFQGKIKMAKRILGMQ